jgi:hypothetical protein
MIASYDLSTDLDVAGRFDAPEFRDAVTHLESVSLKRAFRWAVSASHAIRPAN